MGNWIILERVRFPQTDYRELELHFESASGQASLPKRVVRLWPDGGLELGECQSPFQCRYHEKLGSV